MSLKKRFVDRADAREALLSGEVEPTLTETVSFKPHKATSSSRNERKRARKKRQKG
jgi:hypothetical protein